MDYQLIHLKGKRCSGRAVRFVELDPDLKDELMLQAAKAVGKDSTVIELKRKEWKLGVLTIIKEVSVDPVKGDPNGGDVKWKKYTFDEIESAYSTLFTAKDHALLTATFRDFHEVTEEEID